MALGEVELDDGRAVVGFLCEPLALEGAEDITAAGGWRAYRAQVSTEIARLRRALRQLRAERAAGANEPEARPATRSRNEPKRAMASALHVLANEPGTAADVNEPEAAPRPNRAENRWSM